MIFLVFNRLAPKMRHPKEPPHDFNTAFVKERFDKG